jgi:endonuclease YncB( thermonuclease family)
MAVTLLSPLAHAETFSGRVVAVVDGDTLILQVDRKQYTIRIAGIDAPERHQAWSDQSKTNLGRLSQNQTAVADCARIDPQGKRLCKLTVKAVDIGLEQVKDGMAWWARELSRDLIPDEQSAYQSAQLMAQLKRRGLWSETKPIPPWDFKREGRLFPDKSYPGF